MKFNFRIKRCFRYLRNNLTYYTIREEELENFLSDNNLIIIDVRSKEEFLKMRVKKAININVCNIQNLISNIVEDKNKKIFIYCLNGSRTKIAIDKLNKMGYFNIYIYGNGGINEIKNERLIEF